jgi:hypothetical protein
MKAFVLLCTVGAATGFSAAQVMTFTNRADWEAAVGGGIIVEDFNSTAVQTILDGQTLDTGLLQVTRDGSPNAADGDLEIRDGSSFGNIDGTNFLYGETGVEPHENTLFGFNGQDIFAFGADFQSPFSGDGIDVVVGGTRYSLDYIGGGGGFFGILEMSGGALGSVAYSGTLEPNTFQELWQSDNVGYAVVPAPAGLAVLGLGGLVAARRRR